MGEVQEHGCFLEAVMVANANNDGLEFEAAKDVLSKLEGSERQGIVRVVDCQRCDTTFEVYDDGAVFTRTASQCDGSYEHADHQRAAGDWQLRIDLSRVVELTS
jgi:hypothetical protein